MREKLQQKIRGATRKTVKYRREIEDAAKRALEETGHTAADRFARFATDHLAASSWTPPEPDEMLSMDALIATLHTHLDPVRLRALEEFVRHVVEGVGLDFHTTNPLIAGLVGRTSQHIVSIADTTRAQVQEVIGKSYDAGLSIPDTAKAIRTYMTEAAGKRAITIARTEFAGLVNGGSVAAVQTYSEETGDTLVKQWVTAPGAKDPRHDEYEGLDGQTVGLDEYFEVGDAQLQYPGDPDGPPEEVVNCFLGDTPIAASGIEAVTRHWYEGTIVQVDLSSGVQICGTPNHPVLTLDGWKGLQSLNLGDHLVRSSFAERVGGRDPEVDNVPTVIAQIYDTATQSGAVKRISPTRVDFHGDVPQSEVETVLTGGGLSSHSGEIGGEQVLGGLLHGSGFVPCAGGDGGLSKVVGVSLGKQGLRFADSFAHPGGERSTLLERHAGEPEVPSFGLTSRGDSVLDESAADDRAADAELLGQAVLAFSGEIPCDEVVRVQIFPVATHVFNLQTRDGWYSASGIVAHNCRCTMIYAGEEITAAVQPSFSDKAMVALYPREAEALALTHPEGGPAGDLHVTLAFLGEATGVPLEAALVACERLAQEHAPLEGAVSGVGHFAQAEDGYPLVFIPSCFGMNALRTHVIEGLAMRGVEQQSKHDFVPHITERYSDTPETADPAKLGLPLHFDALTLMVEGERHDFTFGGEGEVVQSSAMEFAATSFKDYPLSARDRGWDKAAAEGRVRKWASSDGSGDLETIDWAKYATAHFWVDPENREQVGGYKLQFVDIVDGPTAVWRGVTLCAAVMQGARGGVDIPDADKTGVQRHIARYYAKAKEEYDDPEITPPWESSVSDTFATEECANCGHAGSNHFGSGPCDVAGCDCEAMSAAIKADAVVTPAPVGSEVKWEATLLVEGVATDDGRMIAPGATSWRELPLSLGVMFQTPHADLVEVDLCGRIDQIWREGNRVMGSGVFEDSDLGRKVGEMVGNGTLTGVSVDLAVLDAEYRAESEPDEAVSDDDLLDTLMDENVLFVVLDGKIGAATVCPFPAFSEAKVSLAAAGDTIPIANLQRQAGFTLTRSTLTASAAGLAPEVPPAWWFSDPQLSEPTPLTVTEEGRVYGHIAPWGTCHIGFEGVCVEPPRSESEYRYFHLGEVLTDAGPLDCGQVTLSKDPESGGHAPLQMSREQAVAHYDNVCLAVADVRAGEDEHGIWVAGALRANVDADRVRELRGAKPSGDWRSFGGSLELIGVLAVNTPGFPVPRARVKNEEGVQLVAALIVGGIKESHGSPPVTTEDAGAVVGPGALSALAARARGGADALLALARGD